MDSLLHSETKKQKLQARKNKNTKSMALSGTLRPLTKGRRGCKTVRLEAETAENRQEQLQDLSVRQAVRLEAETLEKSQERLQHMVLYKSVRFQLETQQQRLERLDKDSQSKRR